MIKQYPNGRVVGVRPTSIYDVVPPSGHAAINKAKNDAALNRVSRKMDAIAQRLEDLAAMREEGERRRRRTGR